MSFKSWLPPYSILRSNGRTSTRRLGWNQVHVNGTFQPFISPRMAAKTPVSFTSTGRASFFCCPTTTEEYLRVR